MRKTTIGCAERREDRGERVSASLVGQEPVIGSGPAHWQILQHLLRHMHPIRTTRPRCPDPGRPLRHLELLTLGRYVRRVEQQQVDLAVETR